MALNSLFSWKMQVIIVWLDDRHGKHTFIYIFFNEWVQANAVAVMLYLFSSYILNGQTILGDYEWSRKQLEQLSQNLPLILNQARKKKSS